MKITRPSRRPRFRFATLEALESRIAPAAFQLPAGAGPYTLEVNPGNGHLHIINGASAEVFDDGVAPDDLTITAAGADALSIVDSAAGSVNLSGQLSVSINGAIHVNGAVTAVTGATFESVNGSIDSTGLIHTTGGDVTISALHTLTLGGAITASGFIHLTADSGAGDPAGLLTISPGAPITATGGLVSLKAADVSIGDTVDAGPGTVVIDVSPPGSIDIGHNSANHLGLSQTELDFLHGAFVQIGDAFTGSIDFTAAVSFAHFSTMQLEGAATFDAGSGFISDISSLTTYTTIQFGSLTVDPTATLAFNAVGGFVPLPTDSFTILQSGSGNGITTPFAGLPEGQDVVLGGVHKTLSYNLLNGGNVVLQAAPSITAVFNGNELDFTDIDGLDNHVTIIRSSTSSGADYIITADNDIFSDPGNGVTVSNGGKTLTIPFSSVVAFSFGLAGGNDALVLDFSNGNVIPQSDITFDGAGGAINLLQIIGGSQGTATYSFASATDGTLGLSAYGTVHFTGLESFTHGGGVTDYAFNLPAGAQNQINLHDNGAASDGISALDSVGSTFASIFFQNPTGKVTITPGTVTDTIAVGALPDFTGGLDLSAAPFASVNFTGGLQLAAGHDLQVLAGGTIEVMGAAQLATQGGGVITFQTARNILVDSGAQISAHDGTISLSASGTTAANYVGITVAGSLSSDGSGTIFLNGQGGNVGTGNHGVLVSGSITATGSGSVSLTGVGGMGSDGNDGILTTGSTISAAGGPILFLGTAGGDTGTSFGIDAGGTVSSTGASIAFATDAGLMFEPGATITINAAGPSVILEPVTAGVPIDLGTAQHAGFGVTSGMLAQISAGLVQIGSQVTSSGAIALSADVAASLDLALITGADISGSAALTLTGHTLTTESVGAVNLSGVITVGNARFRSDPANPIDVTLTNAANDLGTVAVDHGGTISLRDDTGFGLGAIEEGTKLIVQSDGTISQSGALTGGGQLLKLGTGTLRLSQANTIGDTTIQTGAISFSDAGAFGTGTIFVGNSSTGAVNVALLAELPLDLGNAVHADSTGSASVATIGTANFTSVSPATFSGHLTLDRPTILIGGNSGETHFTGTISGNVQTLTIDGGQTVEIGTAGPNTFAGDLKVINNTNFEVGNGPDVIPDGNSVDVASGSFLTLAKAAGANESINRLTGAGTVRAHPNFTSNPQTLSIGAGSSTFQFDGKIQDGASPLSLTKLGTGGALLTGTLSYTGATLVANGILALNSTTSDNPIASSSSIEIDSGAQLDVTGLTPAADPQTFALGAAQTLTGNGTVTGSLAGSGTIAPGLSTPGTLTVTGDFHPSGTLQFKINSPYASAGTDYSQIVVTGNVDLSGATLTFSGGSTLPSGGTAVTLISNAGTIVAGTHPAEGTTVHFGSAFFSISYHGGAASHDVVLTSLVGQSTLLPTLKGGVLTLTDSDPGGHSDNINITISAGQAAIDLGNDFFLSAPTGGSLFNSGHILFMPVSKIGKGIVINGGGGDDTLTLDFIFQEKLPAGGVTFNGGTQGAGGDQLIISNGGDSEGTVTYNYTNAHDGSLVMSAYGKVNYTGLEPIVNLGAADNIIFNLPKTLTGTVATLGDNGNAGDGVSRLSGSGFETTDFLEPHTLTINRGNANDALTLINTTDFDNNLTVGDAAHPFGAVTVTGAGFALTRDGDQLNIAASRFSLNAAQSVSASGGTLTLGEGTISGTIDGGLGVTAIGTTFLNLNGANTYGGPTFLRGPLTLGNSLAAQNTTIHIDSSFALSFANGLGVATIGGLAGAGDLPLADGNGAAITLSVGNNNADTVYSGKLSGSGSLIKIGTGTLALTGHNTQAGGTTILNGTLTAGSDAALGQNGVALNFSGGTFHASNTFTTARPIALAAGTETFEASNGKTLTVAGVISGAGSPAIGPTGDVIFAGTFSSGAIAVSATHSATVNNVVITAPGAKSSIIITPGTTPNTIQSIDLTGPNKPFSLAVKPNSGVPVTVDQIVNNDTTTIKKIVLKPGVTLGDGMDDNTADLAIGGILGKLQLDQVSTHTIMTLGKDLPYLSTYKNHPSLTLANLGDDVLIDVTGDGTTPAGIGGGGLGKVAVGAWGAGGLIKTTQSIASFVVKTGDFDGTIEVDPHHLGAFTTASVGKLSIPTGKWTGAGMQVEGVVAQFLTLGLAQGSAISAGAFGKVDIKGDYAGSVTATADSAVTKTVKGKTTVVATGAIASVSISGDFTGMINGNGAVGAVAVTGTGRFEGTLRGGSIKSITATSFVGPTDGSHNTITAIGSIGNITATTGNLNDYIIAAGTDLGDDAKFGGTDVDADHFASFLTDAKGKKTAVTIGNITIKGGVSGTTIAAGIDPGTMGVYGDGDDVTATPAGGTIKTKIGAIKFDTSGALGLAFDGTTPAMIGNAFEAESMTSVLLGKTKSATTYVTSFMNAQYIDDTLSAIIVRLLA